MPHMLGQVSGYAIQARTSEKSSSAAEDTQPKRSSFGPDREALFGVYLPKVLPVFKPTVFEDLFGPVLQSKNYLSEADEDCDGKNTNDVLHAKKAVLVFFAAQWLPAARDFTPLLVKAYSEYNEGDVEVVYVSDDHDQAAFDSYYGQMPWTAVPWGNQRARQRLCSEFGPQTFPLLVVLKAEGPRQFKVVTSKGCRDVRDYGCIERAMQVWGL